MSTEPMESQPPGEPMLRIETGQHTAAIKRLDTDRDGRFLVTGSDDKTARVWSLPEGRLLRVLRPPSGIGHYGKVYAVAMSPDGATVAVGGVMWEGSVYLFDRETGKLRRGLDRHHHVVNHLTFSPNGEYLAGSYAGGTVLVWATSGWQMLFADPGHGYGSNGCAFDRAGRLATTSDDGLLRLYEPLEKRLGFRLITTKTAPGGESPGGVAFSPDGDRLAVGFLDTPRVSVLSGTNLSPLDRPDTAQIESGNLGVVAWSADGRSLFAGGKHQDSNGRRCPILRWDESGKWTALDAAANTVMDLKPWGAGVLFAAADPRFGGFDERGKKILDRGPETADMRDKRGDAFTVSGDGRSVRFGLERGNQRAVRFDLDRRQVTTDAPADEALSRADIPTELHDWIESTEPLLNDEGLDLALDERSLSVASVSGNGHFILGADWTLRLFDAGGTELWQKGTPAATWGVNVAAGGKLAIAAYGDGTVRWHRTEDGEELLALFAHRDGRRWIAWTPQGYYDASAGADDLIGWQVNRRGDEAADFFPVWQFRERFVRPDVINRVLDTLDVGEAVRAADKAFAQEPQPDDARVELRTNPLPQIELLTPRDGAEFDGDSVTVSYLIRHAAGQLPKGELWAVIDGRPQRVTPNPFAKAENGAFLEATLPLPPSDVTLALELRIGDIPVRSTDVRLRRRGKRPGQLPTLYLLAVGVSVYKYHGPPLEFAHCDADDFTAAMRGQQGILYEQVHSRTLTNKDAVWDEILERLKWLTERATSADVAIVFLSGHGLTDPKGNYYFLPHDFKHAKLKQTSLTHGMLKEYFGEIKAKQRILLIDSCHAGGAASVATASGIEGRFTVSVNLDTFANDVMHGTGATVLTSSTGTQTSIEDKRWKNGAFTEALLEGLAGTYPIPMLANRLITIDALNYFLGVRVKDLTSGRQTPRRAIYGTDFPIARAP